MQKEHIFGISREYKNRHYVDIESTTYFGNGPFKKIQNDNVKEIKPYFVIHACYCLDGCS